MSFIVNWIISAIAVGAAVAWVPGISTIGGAYAGPIFTALFLGIVNACIKPIVNFFSLPITFLTLGLFLFVINALMLELAGYLSRNITHAGILVEGFIPALVGSVVISIVSAILSSIF